MCKQENAPIDPGLIVWHDQDDYPKPKEGYNTGHSNDVFIYCMGEVKTGYFNFRDMNWVIDYPVPFFGVFKWRYFIDGIDSPK